MQSGMEEKATAEDQSAVNEADIKKSVVVASAENDRGPLNGTLCWFGLWLWFSLSFFFSFFIYTCCCFCLFVCLFFVFLFYSEQLPFGI